MTNRTCTIDGCTNPHDSRGMCKMHASRARRAAGAHLKPTPCEVCGTEVLKEPRGSGRRPTCSLACRQHLTHSTWPRSPTPPAPAVSVLPKRHPARVIAAQRSPLLFVTGPCANCGEAFTAYDESSQATTCSTRCAKQLARPRSRVDRDLRTGHVTWRSLMAEGLTDCQICDEPVDLDDCHWVTGRDGRPAFITGQRYPSLDHVTAVANGGAHGRDNAQLAHRGCNALKSDTTAHAAA